MSDDEDIDGVTSSEPKGRFSDRKQRELVTKLPSPQSLGSSSFTVSCHLLSLPTLPSKSKRAPKNVKDNSTLKIRKKNKGTWNGMWRSLIALFCLCCLFVGRCYQQINHLCCISMTRIAKDHQKQRLM
jgi:hypothetical protein